jgi:hypothetical protein
LTSIVVCFHDGYRRPKRESIYIVDHTCRGHKQRNLVSVPLIWATRYFQHQAQSPVYTQKFIFKSNENMHHTCSKINDNTQISTHAYQFIPAKLKVSLSSSTSNDRLPGMFHRLNIHRFQCSEPNLHLTAMVINSLVRIFGVVIVKNPFDHDGMYR